MVKRACPRCNGTGTIIVERPDFKKGPRRDPMALFDPKCRFDMKLESMPCLLCNGSGYIDD